MLFNSYIFIFAFLPITLLGYFLLNHFEKNNCSKIYLTVCSLFFYAYFNPSLLWIIISSILVNYLISLYFINNKESHNAKRRLLFATGLIFNIGLLFVYKYLDFVFDCIGKLFHDDPIYIGLLLPLGISFFTFQQLSFLIDSYKGEAPRYGLLDYTLFVIFFPQLIEGPICYHHEIIPQFNDKAKFHFNIDNFSKGLYSFSMGLAKKVLIADNLGKITAFGFGGISSLSSYEAILTILGYTLQIYFDFSGYCDMANGIALMFNIELPLNFNSPYKARNISDFWKRWHMTLTRFLTKYIYIPLGGSRAGKVRTYVNIMIVFLVSGIWHGAGFTFIVWGLMHGVAMVIHRIFKKTIDKIPYAVTWFITFVFVNLAWVFFRAESLSDACGLIGRVFSGGFTLNYEITETLLNIIPISVVSNMPVIGSVLSLALIMLILFIVLLIMCLATKNIQEKLEGFKTSGKNLIFTYVVLVWSLLSLSGVSTFIYFNF